MDTTIPYPARLARYQFVEALVRVADAKFKQDISAGQSSFELSSCCIARSGNLTGLVLGCLEAKFCKRIFV